ncbi:hypothetical protein R3P38DRAFT_3572436 [Favolaschia claudopus]|uniref:Uncharacterized protein n=1 Tax=Favolaschia claudopus TaxID=2862362 RepID=A0AAW0ARE0_9AGAR
MEWMCELLWLEENERPCGQFVCLTEDWTQSARKIYEARDLAEIQWPASMLGHARYPSYASPSGRLLILALTAYKGMLVDQFLSRQPESTLFAQIKGDYVNRGPPRMTELSSGRAVEVSFELVLFLSFSLWRVPPHEKLIFDLTNEIVEQVIDGVEGGDNRKALTHETEAIAAVSLCVAYSEENVYAAMKEGRVDWAKTDSEKLRDIYGEACGGWLEVEQLKIANGNSYIFTVTTRKNFDYVCSPASATTVDKSHFKEEQVQRMKWWLICFTPKQYNLLSLSGMNVDKPEITKSS